MLEQKSAQKLTTGVAYAFAGCVIYEFLNFAGIANHSLAHWLLLVAWLAAIFVIHTAKPFWHWDARHRLPITIGAALLLGTGAIFLYAIDLPLPPPYPDARVVIDINLSPSTVGPNGQSPYLESNLTNVKEEQRR